MAANKIRLTLDFTEEQLETTKTFFNYNDYCFCMPCITSQRNRQLWWESDAVPPSDSNHGIRKEKYKRFWTMMMHRGV